MAAASLPRVLVVDDVDLVREVFGRFLVSSGMEPSFAVDGLDGLQRARASGPDAIVCDLDMPKMDGIELCRALRTDAVTPRVPIVVVTGSGGEQVRAALDAGCDAVLPKPCSRALLIATIRECLDRVPKWRVA
jgi:two-component system, OmpR family, response regulator MprA